MTRPDFTGRSYADRWKIAVGEKATLTIFVLQEDTHSGILPGSAIVGSKLTDFAFLCHYEGWAHGAMQYRDLDAWGKWQAGIKHAAGRALTEYPTSARQVLTKKDLVEVGVYHAADDRIEITNEAEVRRWLS